MSYNKLLCIILFCISCDNKSELKQNNVVQISEVLITEQDIQKQKPSTAIESLPKEICPDGMVHIDGNYCTKLKQTCLKKWHKNRCKIFSTNSVCKGKEKHLNFCIDVEEYSTDNIPKNNVSWLEAKSICEAEGKRLCTEEEWTLACEGNQRFPYPYGYEYYKDMCNVDKKANKTGGKLVPKFEINDTRDQCMSPFGVHNMIGNVDEWTVRIDNDKMPYRGVLKGGWWSRLIRGACRPRTTEHKEFEVMVQVGFRCCK